MDLSQTRVRAILSSKDVEILCRLVLISKIEDAIRGSHPHKSSGPDGFNAHFFKVCWHIIGRDVSEAVQDFFIQCKLLRQVKNTFIALVPKSKASSFPADFRPISLCKIIARL